MIKKTLVAAAVSGLVVLGGVFAATGASAATQYPSEANCVASPATIQVGATSTITCTGVDGAQVSFTVTGEGVTSGTLSSIVKAVSGTSSVTKSVSGGTASATFTGPAAGTYTVQPSVTGVEGGDAPLNQVTITVTAPGTPTTAPSTGPTLPVTGADFPVVPLVIGAGAVVLGGAAFGIAAVRRRKHS